ncbi:MAG: thioredoxin family protein [bacterium]|nr:thioredoxin family protein [bacterium]
MNKKFGIVLGVIIVLVIIVVMGKKDETPSVLLLDKKEVTEKATESPVVKTKNTETSKGEMEGIVKDEMEKVGSYELYAPEKIAKAENGNVVLFFRASWCPTCRALDKDIRNNMPNIPSDLTILDVDYDNSTALKQKYGVTYQHTLVQVDKDGNMIKKWMGSPTLDDFVKEVL